MKTEPLNVGVLVERRYMSQPQPSGLIAALQERGHRVTVIDDEATVLEVGRAPVVDGYDIVVSRGRSWSLLALLAWIEKQGTPTINRRTAIASVHNKAEMAVALDGVAGEAASFVGSPGSLARRIPEACYPLLVKPIFGDNCRGIEMVRSKRELEHLLWPDAVALAQTYCENGGRDLKLYGIGDTIWAVRKPSPLAKGVASPPAFAPERLPVSPRLRALGRRLRRLFQLDFYGVDCIETSRGPVVVEVNDFPSYTGIPEANEKLSEFVVRRATEGNGR